MKSIALRRSLLACLGVLCIVAATYQLGHSRRTPPEQKRLAPPRFEALLTRLDSAVVADGQATWRSGIMIPKCDASGIEHVTCSVECVDNHGHVLYNVIWDERTGSYRVSFELPLVKARSQHRLTNAAAAATAAREWMDDLGIAQESDHWRLAGDPVRIAGCRQARFRSPDRDVLITVTASTAEITRADVRVIAPASRPASTTVSMAAAARPR